MTATTFGDWSEDADLLAYILVRFLTDQTRPFYYIADDHLTLDGGITITLDEARALLRITRGQIDGPGLQQADPDWWEYER